MLSHVRIDEDDEDFKLCGIYASREDAELAILRYRTKPGFKQYPNGFHISEVIVGKDDWAEGFGVLSDDELDGDSL